MGQQFKSHSLSQAAEGAQSLIALKQYSSAAKAEGEPNEVRYIWLTTRLNTSGLGRMQGENIEERILQTLQRHVAEPYALQRAKSRERSDSAWATMRVDFKRVVLRIKKPNKTIPTRYAYHFEINLSLQVPRGFASNWQSWTLTYRDEQAPEENLAVNNAFWRRFGEALPSLVLSDEKVLNSLPQRLSFNPAVFTPDAKPYIAAEDQEYFADACVLSSSEGQYLLHFLYAPKSRPLAFQASKILGLHCSKRATFIASARAANSLDLIYQPKTSTHAWKSRIPFDTKAGLSKLHFLLQDSYLCLYNKQDVEEAKSFRIYCLNPSSGVPLWEAYSASASLRAMTVHGENLVLALEQGIYVFNPEGDLLSHRVWETSKATLHWSPARYCVSGNILIFSPKHGLFYAYDLETHQILWEQQSFAGDFLHCLHGEKALIYDVGARLIALDLRSHETLWSFYTADIPRDAINYEDLLLLLMKGALYVINPQSGKIEGQLPLFMNPQSFIHYNRSLFVDAPTGIYLLNRSFNQ
ncbi:MAG: PQQ-binding-like beta-propeller repeat protein [Bradymonadales bacterium]